ncbi:HIT family protein [Brevibacillus panacihumi]|uniref:HIT family protein n=1 Tax=Brevibacillus panacihumi TaxID=497735 RepID=UPI003D029B86
MIHQQTTDCLGCRLANGKEFVHIVYETDLICCFLDADPFHEGHTLILPKKHVVELEELDLPTTAAVMEAAKLLASAIKHFYRADGVSLAQNGGACNDLTHFHLHVIPRFLGDGFSWGDSLLNHEAETRLQVTMRKMSDYLKGLA